MKRDQRDPQLVGHKLIAIRAYLDREGATRLPLSRLADMNGLHVPDYDGSGPMSNDPAAHHSKTPQDVQLESDGGAE
jgi:hypothetical protein